MKIYNKLVFDMENMSVLEEDSFEYSGPVDLAAGGMLTKQADQLTAKFLNDVNDSVSGGAIVSVPVGAPSVIASATQPGDRIVLDDATALAVSDTTIGTLLGGVYMYVKTTSVTRPAARGCVAFFKTADLGTAANAGYNVYSDPDPSAAVPTHVAGIYINVISSGNYGWICVAGAVAGQFDNAALTASADGTEVTVKISSGNATTTGYPLDAGVVPTATSVAAHVGVACGLPSSTVISTVMLTRGTFCGRI